jgi:hypothetical protein
MDMNKHISQGNLAKYLWNMGLQEATQPNWGTSEPHTYVRGMEPIDAVWFLPELTITLTMQLSFHEGVGDHRTVLVDISTSSAIGKQEFCGAHPQAQRLTSTNAKARTKYLTFLKRQMRTHWMPERLNKCAQQITSYTVTPAVQHQMQTLDNQTVEMQWGGKHRCHQIVTAALPFSKPVHVLHFWRCAYQALARGTTLPIQCSNVIKQALKAGIPNPRLLTQTQCLDGVKACTRQM